MESQVKELLENVSEVELVYKSKVKSSLRPIIRHSKDSYEVFMALWDTNNIEFVEEFKVLFLNRANRVLGVYHLSKGGMTGTVADIRLIFISALKVCADQIVLAHNHPTGNLDPSHADEMITKKIVHAGECLDIQILDHLIVHPEGYFSFADEGQL